MDNGKRFFPQKLNPDDYKYEEERAKQIKKLGRLGIRVFTFAITKRASH